jgi:hypothetical protein
MPHSAARTNIQIHLAIIRHSLYHDPRIHNRGRPPRPPHARYDAGRFTRLSCFRASKKERTACSSSFEKNLKTMSDHCRNTAIKLRGHVNVHKSPDIAKRQLALGSIGVTCATVAECELMARSGVTGILLTRQPTSKNNINRTIALARREPLSGLWSTIRWWPIGCKKPPTTRA